MPLLTIFTPTFNRKHTIIRTYESLCRQSCKDFTWLIIDDGSSDDTDELVKQWMKIDNGFEIRYCYKENGGLHTAYNKAIEMAVSELMMCIDSDDYMPDNAVELICLLWKEKGSYKIGGIIGLDCMPDGQVIGNELPHQETLNLVAVCVGKINVYGDKKQVIRTDLFKRVAPMPTYSNEKNFNPYYMILKIALDYDFLVLNKNLCFVDYQSDGMTSNQWEQYYNSPNSFAETRKLYLSLPGAPLKFIIKHTIHYISSSLIAGRKNLLSDSPRKFATAILYPFGLILSIVIKKKNKMIR